MSTMKWSYDFVSTAMDISLPDRLSLLNELQGTKDGNPVSVAIWLKLEGRSRVRVNDLFYGVLMSKRTEISMLLSLKNEAEEWRYIVLSNIDAITSELVYLRCNWP